MAMMMNEIHVDVVQNITNSSGGDNFAMISREGGGLWDSASSESLSLDYTPTPPDENTRAQFPIFKLKNSPTPSLDYTPMLPDENARDQFPIFKLNSPTPSLDYSPKLPDENVRDQFPIFQFRKNLKIEQIGPYDSTADSSLNAKKYTPDMIYDELTIYGFDIFTFNEVHFYLMRNTEDLKDFLQLPPKSRKAWIMRRIPKRKGMDAEKETSDKKMKEIDAEDETPNKKRKR